MELIHSEAVLSLAAGLVGVAWTFFRSSDWFARRRGARLRRAVLALEAGVAETYESYVRAIRKGRADGKLTAEERAEARARARAAAVAFGRRDGLDVVRTLGSDYVDLLIARAVKRLKG